MVFRKKAFTLKDGRTAVIRNAKKEDALPLLEFLRTISAETPFLIREPDEIDITREQQEAFLCERMENPNALMLVALVDGQHAGNCSFFAHGGYKRRRHRCDVAIALYQKYCGLGIGRIMLENALQAAKECGYEQAELEVVSANQAAIHLYESLGFRKCGTLPHSMKYQDGTYADDEIMVKML